MSELEFTIKSGSPSSEASRILSYLHSNHGKAMGQIATAVHVSEAELELGACLGSAEHFTTGEKETVNIPVCGTTSHPSVYVHTQPMMSWRPSKQDILQTAEREDLTRGFVTLTSNGINSVFGSITALPKSITDKILNGELTGSNIRSEVKSEGHLVKITSKDSPDVTESAVESAVKSGLLDKSHID